MTGPTNPPDMPSAATVPTRTHHVVHDSAAGDLSVTVVAAVAEAVDADPTEVMVPVYERVDPDALDAIFGDRPDGTPRTEAHVTFDVWDLRVVVHADGHVYVHPPDD